MARMHTGKKGKSSSKKPSYEFPPSWASLSKEEVENIIVKLVKEGKSESEIGMILRDQYGVPSVKRVTGKKLGAILKEKKIESKYPLDLIQLIKRAVRIRNHLKNNKKDLSNLNALKRVESKILRSVKYYRGKKLPADWKYEPEKAALLVK
jgi:small subunit ribosomal protein S15